MLLNKLGYSSCNCFTAFTLSSLVIDSSFRVLCSLLDADNSSPMLSIACLAASLYAFCDLVVELNISLSLSKFSISKPTPTTKAPIPVAIIAALRPLKATDVVSTEPPNAFIIVPAKTLIALLAFCKALLFLITLFNNLRPEATPSIAPLKAIETPIAFSMF